MKLSHSFCKPVFFGWLSAAAALLALAFPLPVVAQTPAPISYTASLKVLPESAPSGVMRTLLVDGQWPSGCVPVSATVRAELLPTPQLIVTLQRAATGPCTLAPRFFNFALSHKPSAVADLPVVIQTDDGVRGGEGLVRVTNAGSIISLTPIVSVEPELDTPNRPRTLIVSGHHLTGCPYSTPFIDPNASLLLNGVAIRLDPVPTLVACSTTAFTPFRFELPFTPTSAGTSRMVALAAGGEIRGEGLLRTVTTSGATRALGDISGSWYDPATNGSGIQFTHNFGTTDVAFATIYLYDPYGRARWLSVQNAQWVAGGTTLTGDLLEARAEITALPCGSGPCDLVVSPRHFSTSSKIGTVRITFSGLGTRSGAVTGLFETFSSNTGGAMFKMDIVKLAF